MLLFPDLEARHAAIASLQAKAWALRDQGLPGVVLWRQLIEQALLPYWDLHNTVKASDCVMQDLAVVILGPFALKYLNWFDQIRLDLVQDPLVNDFLCDFKDLKLPDFEVITQAWWQAGYAGKIDDTIDPGLDSHLASDFRVELNDGTDNQIFHCFFYQFMAYVTQANFTIRAASVYHELFDKGGSTQDHSAALLAIHTGSRLRQLRDGPDPGAALEQWPEVISAVYGQNFEGLAPLALELRQETHEILQNPGFFEGLLRSVEETLIRLKNG
jgi:hypothetical protein